jgi:hypothetical protein
MIPLPAYKLSPQKEPLIKTHKISNPLRIWRLEVRVIIKKLHSYN